MATITVEQALDLAKTFHQGGQFAAAETICRRILQAEPEHADTLHTLGVIAMATGRNDEALDCLSKAVARSPGQGIYRSNLGVLHRRLGRMKEAVACLERALALEPNSPEIHLNLGDAFFGLERFDEAITCTRRALALRADYPLAHNNLGNALKKKGQRPEAIICYRQALALSPNYPEALNNLGNALSDDGQWESAVHYYQRALALRPDYAEAHHGLGSAYFGMGRWNEALAHSRRAVALDPDSPDAHCNLALPLLLLGHYEEGWRHFDWRLRSRALCLARNDITAPRWDGSPAAAHTILVHAEQGLGDTIQFFRYLPLVVERSGADRVILECQPELGRLLEQNRDGSFELVARRRTDKTDVPHVDRHLPLLSIPLALGLFKPRQIAGPYLRAGPQECRKWRERLGQPHPLRIGIAWAGNPSHDDDHRRSIDPRQFLPLLHRGTARFHSLQVGFDHHTAPDLTQLGLVDDTPDIQDFADTAALIAELDLVISVDTAVAHLAGALGKPVWTLLPFVPDWRWGLGREDTPWYPTMRLFRQPAPGDWDSVLGRVAGEISALAARRG